MATTIVAQPAPSEIASPRALLARLKASLRCAQEDAARLARLAAGQLVVPASVELLTFDLAQAQEALRLYEAAEQAALDRWCVAHEPRADETSPMVDGDDDLDRLHW